MGFPCACNVGLATYHPGILCEQQYEPLNIYREYKGIKIETMQPHSISDWCVVGNLGIETKLQW